MTGPQIVTGQRGTMRVEVRRERDSDQVSIALDEAKVGDWSGDRHAISNSLKEGLPHDRRVSLWIHPGGNEFVLHRIRVRMRWPFEHNGSVATLEDWFDPSRLENDYVPTGWKGPAGTRTRAVEGHPFGLRLASEDKTALIAFLKSL